MKKRRVILGLVGMPGAGKGVFRKIIQRLGFPVIIMGDIVREEAKRRKLRSTAQNLGSIMLNLRELEGQAAIAKRCITKVKNLSQNLIVIDGLRSLFEVEEFRKDFPTFIIIAIHASPRTRYKRLLRRKRSDDSPNWETFLTRDIRELEIGVGSVISIADHMIVNEGTMTQLRNRIMQVLVKVTEK